MPLQNHLFQRIRECLPPGASLAEAVADCLHLSPDSVYRRLRGETPLVLEEAATLCAAYGLSLDQHLAASPGTLSFTARKAGSGDLAPYLRFWLDELTRIGPAGRLVCASRELPWFHQFLFPRYFAFRYFFWMKSVARHPDFRQQLYAPDIVPADIRALGAAIAEAYATLPSVEVWTAEAVNSALATIDHYRQAGYFSSDRHWQEVCLDLQASLEHLQAQAEVGAKFLPGANGALRPRNFELFHNRLGLSEDTVLTEDGGRARVFLPRNDLEVLVTTDEPFCRDVKASLEDCIRRSTLLSRVSEKQRQMYFNHLVRKIPALPQNPVPR